MNKDEVIRNELYQGITHTLAILLVDGYVIEPDKAAILLRQIANEMEFDYKQYKNNAKYRKELRHG